MSLLTIEILSDNSVKINSTELFKEIDGKEHKVTSVILDHKDFINMLNEDIKKGVVRNFTDS
ncbi:MAG: hypothetical protein A3F72_19680 [Bacteroidetes bacterium RIFCSPLOWO2_12_FULL_35_15]|nr:MAG: hypothetical protein A3F72_19680 [Bacteroidetes bacterium RIFCSPLOWO2_12_FULL_35_15]